MLHLSSVILIRVLCCTNLLLRRAGDGTACIWKDGMSTVLEHKRSQPLMNGNGGGQENAKGTTDVTSVDWNVSKSLPFFLPSIISQTVFCCSFCLPSCTFNNRVLSYVVLLLKNLQPTSVFLEASCAYMVYKFIPLSVWRVERSIHGRWLI